MSKVAETDIISLIQDNCNKIKDKQPKIDVLMDSNITEKLKLKFANNSDALLNDLINELNEISPFVKKLRKYISDITEHTPICAIYLLLSGVLNTWDSIILLANKGKYSSIMILLRSIEEALMQCKLFLLDSNENKTKNINEWFNGSIISHGTGRDKMTANLPDEGIDIRSMQSYLYKMESMHTHTSYISILENVSPYSEDYDLDGCTGYYRTNEALQGIALPKMNLMAITLKGIYKLIVQDNQSVSKLNNLISKYNPNMGDVANFQKVIDKFPKN